MCSDVFKGNVQRLKSVCIFNITQVQSSFSDNLSILNQQLRMRTSSFDEIDDVLQKAMQFYKNCDWGQGLCYFNFGLLRLH